MTGDIPICITRDFKFCAGHRLLGHKGKCRFIHGHNYVASVTLQGPVDPLGIVVDFSDFKTVIGGWIDENWDHNLILHADDPLLSVQFAFNALAFVEEGSPIGEKAKADKEAMFAGRLPFVMPGGMNPTAENMVFVLLAVVAEKAKEHWPNLSEKITVTVYETETCSASLSNY